MKNLRSMMIAGLIFGGLTAVQTHAAINTDPDFCLGKIANCSAPDYTGCIDTNKQCFMAGAATWQISCSAMTRVRGSDVPLAPYTVSVLKKLHKDDPSLNGDALQYCQAGAHIATFKKRDGIKRTVVTTTGTTTYTNPPR